MEQKPLRTLGKTLEKTISRIQGDILNLKNIDRYLVASLAIIFAIVGLFGDIVSSNIEITIILAALGVLVFNLTIPDETPTQGLDDFLNDRHDLPKLSETLANVQEVWIYSPSAANIFRGDNLGVIKEHILKNPDGHLRILIQDPTEENAVDILKKHLDEGVVELHNQSMPNEISETLRILKSIHNGKRSGKLSYGLMSYGLGFSILIFNPNESDGFLILEVHGFRNEDTRSRMHIRIDRSESERWYSYWKNQMTDMWKSAKIEQDESIA